MISASALHLWECVLLW